MNSIEHEGQFPSNLIKKKSIEAQQRTESRGEEKQLAVKA